MSSKGEFNWIFVLVAGAIILVFFIGFSYKHIGLSNKLTDKNVLLRLESDIESYSKALQSDKPLSIPGDLEIEFRCGIMKVNSESKNTNLIVFSPGVLLRDAFIWTKSWDYPFKIVNFYFVSDKERTFFVVDNQKVYQEIPSRFKKIFLNKENKDLILNKLQDSNAVFVFNGDFELPSDYKAKVVQVYSDSEAKLNGNGITYYGDEMLYGLIFSKNYEEFMCLQRKANENLRRISDVYKGKADLLKTGRECSLIYTALSNLLGEFAEKPENYNIIIDQNKNLEKNGCVPLF